MPSPRPAAPSTAHRRCGQRSANAINSCGVAVFTESRTVPTIVPSGLSPTAVRVDFMRVDTDGDHSRAFRVANGGGSAVGNLTSGHLMPLLSHTAAGAGGSGRL